MNLRDQLLSHKPTIKAFDIDGITYYIRELTVGDVNREAFEFRQWLIQQAENQGIELNYGDDEALNKQLAHIENKYRLARNIAIKLCDENGENLFDPENIDDLNEISKLNDRVLYAFNNAVGEPKNSPAADDSK